MFYMKNKESFCVSKPTTDELVLKTKIIPIIEMGNNLYDYNLLRRLVFLY